MNSQLTPEPFWLGRYEARVISAGTFALDGGAMFGVVPKTLWQKQHPANDDNTIDLATNLLLLRDDQRTILVDTGMGDKWSERHAQIFHVNAGPLRSNLQKAGINADDITDVFLTHLHFDHAGGLTTSDGDNVTATFKSARIHVGKRNWQWAHAPTERDRGSYRDENFAFLQDGDQLVLHDDERGCRTQIFPDFEVFCCEGHTEGQMLPYVGARDQRALYAADMLPTRAHVRIAWHMAYDIRPLDVMREKRALLETCVSDDARVIFEHDPHCTMAKIQVHKNDFRAEVQHG